MRAAGCTLAAPDDLSWRTAAAERQVARDVEFATRQAAVQTVLKLYEPMDVAISLGVSELFLPNVASQVKHIYPWRIFASIAPDRFGNKRISSYPEFVEFLQQLYMVLPSFPMLEDFIPEADWGTVRVRLDNEYGPMFYGSSIERSPDFVESFRITFGGANEAMEDMDLALAIQRHVLTKVPPFASNIELDFMPGSLEVPPEDFWHECKASLQSVHDSVDRRLAKSSAYLVSELGVFDAPKTEGEFGNLCMQGSVWPFLGLWVNGRFVPTSIRNAPASVIDYWAVHSKVNINTWAGAHTRLAAFISDRFARAHAGPLRLRTRHHILSTEVSVVIPAASGIYVISICEPDKLASTEKFAQDFQGIVDSGESWGIIPVSGHAFGLQNSAGLPPNPSDIKIIIVLAQGGTGPYSVPILKSPARFMPLVDFISIFDSLKDLNELERFWSFVDDGKKTVSPFSQGLADMFASFRDTSEVLVDGAVNPTFISLDPHWNSTWRYRELCEFWMHAPIRFPDASPTWNARRNESGVIELRSRQRSAVAYTVVVGQCTVQFVVEFIPGSSSLTTLRMIDLFAQALADRLYSNREILANATIFACAQLVIECVAEPTETIDNNARPENGNSGPLIVRAIATDELEVARTANLKLFVSPVQVQHGLDDARDASFEVEALVRTVEACSELLKSRIAEEVIEKIRSGASGPARFHLQVVPRTVDVPDFQDPVVPSATEYKLARRTLALKLHHLGFTPGRYELAEAKTRLDAGRNALREHLDASIEKFDSAKLIQACIEQNDELLAKDRGKIIRARQSLNHEVDYDRIKAIAEANKEQGPLARHYRYLLEKVVSSPVRGGVEPVVPSTLKELIGLIDWYMVLAGASDVLHNNVDVGGVDIDDNFIPDVFYSENWASQEKEYIRELAKTTLGVNIDHDDAVEGASRELLESDGLREAFINDAGFDLRNLLDALLVLSQWVTRGFAEELDFSYSASADEVAKAFEQSLPDLSADEAVKIVQFLTLCPLEIRRLEGKELAEGDVPFWEHNKRLHRYTIRPLVPVNSQLCWGAEQASRSMSIWLSTVVHGYLPGDFKWPSVVQHVRSIKESIETNLERRTEEIFKRHTPYVIGGVDFFKKFKGKGFADVGDFDVLAYWPDTNILVYAECKYNQPAFSVKDSRRLRDRIFGSSPADKKGQFVKIVGRRSFVEGHRTRMLELLNWPIPSSIHEPTNIELYVSREIHWWMMHPPYAVPTKFVRVDTLDAWLRNSFEHTK